MNYIKEINAFYQKQETNPVSAHAANLWHALMHVNNRAGWKLTFTVAVSVLCFKANLTNSTFKRARKELRDKGYIHYESRRGNQSAIYQIIRAEEVEQAGEETSLQSKEKEEMDHKAAPLVKQKEIKQRTPSTALVDFFEENIGEVQPYIKQEMTEWIDLLGEELVLTAMKRAVERGKGSWSYSKAILKAWHEKGYKTVVEVEQEIIEFQTNKKKRSRPESKLEVIPTWFKDRHKRVEKAEVDLKASETDRRELAELIASYASG